MWTLGSAWEKKKKTPNKTPGDRFIFSGSKLRAGTGKRLDVLRLEVYER